MGLEFELLFLFTTIFTLASFVECFPSNSEDVEAISSSYSEDERKCFALSKVWFNGKCEELKSQASCDPGEWLVLKTPEEYVFDHLIEIQPECQQKNCTEKNEFWWDSEYRCVTKSEALENFCQGKDVLIDHDPFGDGYCTCYDDAGSFEDSNDCYEFYQKGRCDITEVVTYNKTNKGYAYCTKDLCFELNHPNLVGSRPPEETYESSVSEKKLYAPLGGSGQCYRFGPQAICDHLGEGAQFKFHPILKVPKCFISTSNALYIVGSTPHCKYDEQFRCREEVILEQKSELEYLLRLKEQAIKKRDEVLNL